KTKEIEKDRIIEDLINGIKPDLSKRIYSPDEIKQIIEKEKIFDFYKWLLKMIRPSKEIAFDGIKMNKPERFRSQIISQITDFSKELIYKVIYCMEIGIYSDLEGKIK